MVTDRNRQEIEKAEHREDINAKAVTQVDSSGNSIGPSNPQPVEEVNKLTITNSLSETAYDLQASSYSGTTNITSSYTLAGIVIDFTTRELRTVTLTDSQGTVLWYEENDDSINLTRNLCQGFSANDNLTLTITQTSGACLADIKLKTESGSAILSGNPILDPQSQTQVVSETGVPWKIEDDGCGNVCIQDQTTIPITSYFSQEISSFTLASNISESGITSLVYSFEATGGHGISVGDEIILLDTNANRSFSAFVNNVSTNTIKIDRPIDHSFASSTTLGRIITSEMAVDGSVTPQIFTVKSGSVPSDFVSLSITMLDNLAMSDDKFGSLPALDNGLVLRIVNGFQKTIFTFKTNRDIKQFFNQFDYYEKSGGGLFGLDAHFNGREITGVVLRVSGTSVVQWIVQDNLSDLDSIKGSVMGHYTEGEQ